ncbi:Imm1 family immunity protein [Actinokineospora diospyrosa]|uniref:Immunity protein Imm1 n=1 Tax=Actinokineospora diospyrosa TaxID=103728 RepID=A0ABT1IKY5_9PSEU|nr:Imm1 family immunity protein [Actinokineospora diospyrosa]MCP2273312.1 Immunity protein Imm1 [Actinokineospora diospyrosa]
MTGARVYFEGDDPLILRTADEVTAFLDVVQAGSREHELPLFTQWYLDADPGAVEFGVGVNGDRGALTFSGGNWPGLWFSQGTSSTEGLLSYDYMGHERPVPASSEVPFDDVGRAAVEFLTTGARPTCVKWVELG